MMPVVAVLMGGISAEREVSLNSGAACAEALRQDGFTVHSLDVTADIGKLVHDLKSCKAEVVFNALHGRFGEDGCIQGLLNLLGLPFTHTGVAGSALAMDKERAKATVAAVGVRVPESHPVTCDDLTRGHDPLPRPFVVKPVHEGSSVGVYILHPGDQHRQADFGDRETALMAERYIPGRELTVTVMADKALTVTELVPTQGFYDYNAKYSAGKTEHIIPANIPQNIFNEALHFAELAHRSLGCRALSRSDFRYDDTGDGKLYYLETNTQPGMTPLSLVPEQAAWAGMDFSALCRWLVEQALTTGKKS